MVNEALMLDVTVAVVADTTPAVVLIPQATPKPPPLPCAVPRSSTSVIDARLAFVQPEKAADALSLSRAMILTIRQLSTVVVKPGADADVLALAFCATAVTSHGLPLAMQFRNVIILAYTWLPGSATVGVAMDVDVARHQNAVIRVPFVVVPVAEGLLSTATNPAAVLRVAASPPQDSTRSNPISPTA
jgi:hypothetical protein